MFSKESMKTLADAHYEDFKEELMDLTCIPGLQISERIFEITNSMVNDTHNDEAFDAGRDILEMMEIKWVEEQFRNINGYNSKDFISKYEAKAVTDARVKEAYLKNYNAGYNDAVDTWETNFAKMSGYEFAAWKLKRSTPMDQPELDDWSDEPTPEEEFAWKEMEKALNRGDK